MQRAIGHNTFPISIEEDFTTIDKILVVCAALCNLQHNNNNCH